MRRLLASPVVRRRLVVLGLAAVAVWVALFDSHSVLRRVRYHREYRAVAAENARLRVANEALRDDVRAGLTRGVVERVAREQYGMRRPGETVYRVTEGE